MGGLDGVETWIGGEWVGELESDDLCSSVWWLGVMW